MTLGSIASGVDSIRVPDNIAATGFIAGGVTVAMVNHRLTVKGVAGNGIY